MSRLAIEMMAGVMLFGRGSSCWLRRVMRGGGAMGGAIGGIILLVYGVSSILRPLSMRTMVAGVNAPIRSDCLGE
jgi:hypothetical protein